MCSGAVRRKYITSKIILRFIAVIIWLPSVLFAQDVRIPVDPDTLRSVSLEEVAISRAELSKRHTSPVPLQVLTAAELQKTGSFSVADAMRYLSGTQLKDYGGVGGLKTVNVRSLGSNHTAVFYDGIQLVNAQNGQVDLGKFSLDNIEEIALYNGQKPDLLQPARAYSAANAIYLKTRKPEFHNQKPYSAAINIRSGSFGLINPSAYVDLRLTSDISARVSSEYINSHGRYKFRYTNGVFDTTAFRNNGDISAFRIEASLHGKIDSGEWRLQFYHYDSSKGLPRAIVSNRFNASQRQWDENSFLQATYSKSINRRYSLLLNAKAASDYTRYLDPEHVGLSGFLDNHYKQKEFYLSLANRYRLLPFWDIALTADYQNNSLDANIYRFAYPVRNSFLTAFATSLHFPRFNLQGSLLATFVNEAVEEYKAAGDKMEYTPSLMASWQPFSGSNMRVRGFYKSIFRMPTFNDLYYTFVGSTFLKPEYTRQYNLGLSFVKVYDHTTIDFQTDVYYNNVKDKIVAVPSANLFRWTMMNLDEVEIRGLEASLRSSSKLTALLNVTAGLTYTYQKAIDATPGGFTQQQQIPYTPLHSGSFIASAEYKRYSLNYSFLYAGERYSQKANIRANYVEPWYTHDVSCQFRLPVRRQLLTARFEINNMLNQHYDVIMNFPMPGRSYRISLKYEI
jgi:outer membrane cobalamin receptor